MHADMCTYSINICSLLCHQIPLLINKKLIYSTDKIQFFVKSFFEFFFFFNATKFEPVINSKQFICKIKADNCNLKEENVSKRKKKDHIE